jgi:hypothetical protein
MDAPSIERRNSAGHTAPQLSIIAGRREAASGVPARSDSAVWGRSVQRSQGIACRPSGIDPGVCVPANTEEGVQPEKPHRLPCRSARPVQGGVCSTASSRWADSQENIALLTGRFDQGEHRRNFCEVKLRRCGGGGTTAASEQSLREKELNPLRDRSRMFGR